MADVQNGDSEGPHAKIPKIDKENGPFDETDDLCLSDFNFERILSNNTNRKTVFVLGNLKNKTGAAILTLEKKAFVETELNETGYFNNENQLKKHFCNDIYSNYDLLPKPGISSIKVSFIYPATEKHIKKYSYQLSRLILETPQLYEKVTIPHLEKEQFNLQWAYNILDGTQEADRVVYSDPDPETGFVLLPDLKWDGVSKETLYLLAITRKRDIKSLRDLNVSHLPLLKAIRKNGESIILEKYGLQSDQLRIYLHYQPSFYHLHVHFTALRHEAPGITTEKSHLLSTVIDNIELLSNYYQLATLPCVLRETDNLCRLMLEATAENKLTDTRSEK